MLVEGHQGQAAAAGDDPGDRRCWPGPAAAAGRRRGPAEQAGGTAEIGPPEETTTPVAVGQVGERGLRPVLEGGERLGVVVVVLAGAPPLHGRLVPALERVLRRAVGPPRQTRHRRDLVPARGRRSRTPSSRPPRRRSPRYAAAAPASRARPGPARRAGQRPAEHPRLLLARRRQHVVVRRPRTTPGRAGPARI